MTEASNVYAFWSDLITVLRRQVSQNLEEVFQRRLRTNIDIVTYSSIPQ